MTITTADVLQYCADNNILATEMRDLDSQGNPVIDAMGVIMEQVYDEEGAPLAIQWDFKGYTSLATSIDEILSVSLGCPALEDPLPKDYAGDIA